MAKRDTIKKDIRGQFVCMMGKHYETGKTIIQCHTDDDYLETSFDALRDAYKLSKIPEKFDTVEIVGPNGELIMQHYTEQDIDEMVQLEWTGKQPKVKINRLL